MAEKVKKKFIHHDIENDYRIYYSKKDGRYRASNKKTGKGVSYPRLIMENYLGRYLDKNEDVHHIDGDKTNGEHQRLHNPKDHIYDIFCKCPVCGITFQWTEDMQRSFRKNRSRKNEKRYLLDEPVCSKSCAGKYGTIIQKRMKQEKEKNKYL